MIDCTSAVAERIGAKPHYKLTALHLVLATLALLHNTKKNNLIVQKYVNTT
jgi:hypothetical protein